MAFTPGHTYDVFVSYAHADNGLGPPGEGWVVQFVSHLDAALRQRLGGSQDLRVFFDSRHLQANHQLEELLQAARQSAVFLAIASRSYAAREWTKRELDAFARTSNDKRRLFAIECLPLDDHQAYPPPLRDQMRLPFWQVDAPNSQTPMPLSPRHEAFNRKVHDVAEQIQKQLVALKATAGHGGGGSNAAGNGAATPPSNGRADAASTRPASARSVLLAQVTDDLEEERERVRTHLEQFGVPILPAANHYPQGGDAFKAAFAADLARADLFVQLLGGFTGKAPPDLPEGYSRYQSAAAAARPVETLQWRRPDLDAAAVANPSQRELLMGEAVMAVSLVAFSDEIVRRASKPPPAPKTDRSAVVFINAAEEDIPIARKFQDEFGRHDFPSYVQPLTGPLKEREEIFEEYLLDSPAVVFLYGQTTPTWVDRQLKRYNKLKHGRSEPPRILALVTGPPPEKADVGFNLPGLQRIDCSNTAVTDAVRRVIEALGT